MIIKKVVAIIVLSLSVFAFTACESKGTAEKVGENIDEAVEKTTDKAKEVTDAVKDKAEEVGDEFN